MVVSLVVCDSEPKVSLCIEHNLTCLSSTRLLLKKETELENLLLNSIHGYIYVSLLFLSKVWYYFQHNRDTFFPIWIFDNSDIFTAMSIQRMLT